MKNSSAYDLTYCMMASWYSSSSSKYLPYL